MSRRPTRRAAAVTGVGLLLVLAASTAQAGWLYVLAAGVSALVGASLLIRHRLSAVVVERALPEQVRAGDDVAVTLAVGNPGSATVPALRLEDHHPAFSPRAVLVEALPPAGRAVFEQVLSARRRGVYEGGTVVLTTGWPFGIVRSRRTLAVPGALVVAPRWVQLGSFPILEPSSSPAEPLHERARTRAGEEYFGVREYRPGDPKRFVHWRSTARAGRLVVREFEEEIAAPLGLVLCGASAKHADEDPAFEALVEAAASIGLYALSTGHPLECVSAGPARLSSPTPRALLAWLAATEPADAAPGPLVSALLSRARRRGTVVVLAPDCGAAGAGLQAALLSVQAAGSRAIAVVADASSFGAELPITPFEGAGRAVVRRVRAGEELRRCLAG